MNSPAGHTTQLVQGFPIRTPSDQRSIGNSPRLNAALHVLHRLSMPRHPPYALKNTTQKTHKRIKMLASTIQFSHTTPHTRTTTNSSSTTMQGHRTTHTCHPRHPTAHQHTPQNIAHDQPHTTPQSTPHNRGAGMHPPGYSTKTGSTTHGHSTSTPHNREAQKQNSLERR